VISIRYVLLSACVSGPLLAGFSSTSAFETSADLGGGGGFAFTGSGSSHGLSCASCHLPDGPATGRVGLVSDPPGLFVTGYVPGTTYRIGVNLDPERRGLDRNGHCEAQGGGCNRNGFVAEVLGPDLQPAGKLCTDSGFVSPSGCDGDSGQQTSLFNQGRAVGGISLEQPRLCGPAVTGDCIDVAGLLASGKSQDEVDDAIRAGVRGRTQWAFQWRAPDAPDPVAFHIGIVDGDGGTRISHDFNDYYNDDVYLATHVLWPEGVAHGDSGGCAQSVRSLGEDTATGMCVVLFLTGLALRRVRSGPTGANRGPYRRTR